MPNFKPKKAKKKRTVNEKKTWINKLDTVFSLYIRLRDSKHYGYRNFRCISCGEPKSVDQMDCGHFVSRNCMALRWDERNAHGECQKCNRFLSDHLIGYRRNLIIKLGEDAISGSAIAYALEPQKKLELIKKMGEQRVQELEAMKYTTKKWGVEELKQMYMYYAALVLEMKNDRHI